MWHRDRLQLQLARLVPAGRHLPDLGDGLAVVLGDGASRSLGISRPWDCCLATARV